jgi:hypothetical protein
MRKQVTTVVVTSVVAALLMSVGSRVNACGKHQTISGKLLELTCVFDVAEGKKFDKEYAQKRAKTGSPLVVQLDDGTILFPVPVKDTVQQQSDKLMERLGERVTMEGLILEHKNMKVIAPDTVRFDSEKVGSTNLPESAGHKVL